MKRALFRWLRQIGCAILVLGGLYGGAEIALRVYDSWSGQVTRKHGYDRGLLCKNWSTHHELKPLLRVGVPNPDSGEPIAVVTNSFGVRGPEIAIPKPPGIYRILCLGDDQTFGAQVVAKETFCVRLQQILQARSRTRIEVINAGVPDYCPLLSCLQYRHKLLGLQADLVILHLDLSDIADDYRYRRHVAVVDSGAPLSCAHPELEVPRNFNRHAKPQLLLVPEMLKQHGSWLWAKQVLPKTPPETDAPLSKYVWLKEQAPDWSVYIRQALAPVVHLRDISQGMHADFVVATYPAPWQVSAVASNAPAVREAAGVELGAHYDSRRPFEILSRNFQDAGIPFCDASPSFQTARNGALLYFQNAPYFTSEGHALYAQVVADFLVQRVRGVWRPETPTNESRRPLTAERVSPRHTPHDHN